MSVHVKPRCEHCGSANMRRLISRVVAGRSSSSADDLDERMFTDVDENDPRSVARFARRMREEMGEDMGPEFDEAIEQMEAGEMPAGDWAADDD
jgi:hypothetical protein